VACGLASGCWTRRDLLLASCALGALPAAAASALARTASLEVAAKAAHRSGHALVLLASTPGCPWCKLVRESYLAPLQAAGQPVVEIDMTGSGEIADFDGAPTTEARLARRLKIGLAPTVLFLGGHGEELAPRLRGVASTDFYGAYLQQRVDDANRAASRGGAVPA
jgi:hypothetical protein